MRGEKKRSATKSRMPATHNPFWQKLIGWIYSTWEKCDRSVLLHSSDLFRSCTLKKFEFVYWIWILVCSTLSKRMNILNVLRVWWTWQIKTPQKPTAILYAATALFARVITIFGRALECGNVKTFGNVNHGAYFLVQAHLSCTFQLFSLK